MRWLFVVALLSLQATVAAAQGTPDFTRVDIEERSASYGAGIELYEEDGRLRFAINIDSVERSHIKVSSRLLDLAKIVRDADR